MLIILLFTIQLLLLLSGFLFLRPLVAIQVVMYYCAWAMLYVLFVSPSIFLNSNVGIEFDIFCSALAGLIVCTVAAKLPLLEDK